MKELWATLGAIIGSVCVYVLIIIAVWTFSLGIDEITNRLDTIIRLLETGRRRE